MDWHLIVFEVIDMRSFSNLWYWIGLAVVWSSASHWVLGVPFDMVTRARRGDNQAEQDLTLLVRINGNRLLFIVEEAGLWVMGLACFLLTMLVALGFFYGVELAQAVFFMAFPMSLVGILSLRTAAMIRSEDASGPQLYKRMTRLRIGTQVIGMISIFVTSLWGMYQNLTGGFPGS